LYENKYAALLIEGGARVLNDCIRLGFYDEIVQIINENTLGGGISAPILPPGLEAAAAPQQIASDQIFRWVKKRADYLYPRQILPPWPPAREGNSAFHTPHSAL
jgi:riboflavin biosynthesis pyrimidine reductase